MVGVGDEQGRAGRAQDLQAQSPTSGGVDKPDLTSVGQQV